MKYIKLENVIVKKSEIASVTKFEQKKDGKTLSYAIGLQVLGHYESLLVKYIDKEKCDSVYEKLLKLLSVEEL